MIKRADVIILPQSCESDMYKACRNSAACLFPDYDARFAYPGKIGQSLLFKYAGFPHPKTRIWNSVEEFRTACEGGFPHDMPFLLKADRSHEAEGLCLVENSRTLETALGFLQANGKFSSTAFISQDFIPAEGNVLRVVIMGDNLISYWKRPGHPGQKITTVSKGAGIDKEWRPDLQEKGRSLAQRFSVDTRINLAAVDFLFPLHARDPQPVFLEVNYYFGRRGLGGSLPYYRLLFEAVKQWLWGKGFDAERVKLI